MEQVFCHKQRINSAQYSKADPKVKTAIHLVGGTDRLRRLVLVLRRAVLSSQVILTTNSRGILTVNSSNNSSSSKEHLVKAIRHMVNTPLDTDRRGLVQILLTPLKETQPLGLDNDRRKANGPRVPQASHLSKDTILVDRALTVSQLAKEGLQELPSSNVVSRSAHLLKTRKAKMEKLLLTTLGNTLVSRPMATECASAR